MEKIEENFNSDSQKLLEFLNSVPHGDYNNMRARMVEACMVPRSTFRNWLAGLCRIPPLAKKAIEEVAGRKIF